MGSNEEDAASTERIKTVSLNGIAAGETDKLVMDCMLPWRSTKGSLVRTVGCSSCHCPLHSTSSIRIRSSDVIDDLRQLLPLLLISVSLLLSISTAYIKQLDRCSVRPRSMFTPGSSTLQIRLPLCLPPRLHHMFDISVHTIVP